MKFFNLSEIALIKALVVNLAITAIWYFFEYQQFHELQWDRQGDNVVGVLYFLVTWYLFYKLEKGRKNKE